MHPANEFLRSLALVLGVAALTTLVFQRLRQPVVLGYLLAGLIIGPHVSIPLVADPTLVQTLSELGVILLMFSLGMEFSFAKLAKVGPAASVTAMVQSTLMVWLGFAVGRWLGWNPLESIFTGALIAISSTTIIAKAYGDLGIKGPLKELVVGILVVEDLIAIVLMAALTALAAGKGLGARDLLGVLGSLGGFLFLLIAGGMLIVPRTMRAAERFGNGETLLVSAVGICFVMALLAHQAGYSVALGAFLAGTLMAESGHGAKIEDLVAPVRDIFAAVFFVSVGMLLDPREAVDNLGAVAAITLAVLVGKVLFVFLGTFLTGRGVRTAAQAGLSLAQIGEFSFIIAGLGVSLHVIGTQLYSVAVAVSAITTLMTPWMIRYAAPLAERFEKALPGSLQTFVSLYGAWAERLGPSITPASRRSRVRRLFALLLLDTALLAGLIILVALNVEPMSVWLEAHFALHGLVSSSAAVIVAFLAALPLCFGILAVTGQLTQTLTQWSFPPPEMGKVDQAAAPRRALSAALYLGFLVVVIAPLLALTQPFLPGWIVALFLAVAFLASALFFWRRAVDLQGHVRAGSQMLMEMLASQGRRKGPSIADLSTLEGFLPGLGAPRVFRLTPSCPAVGRTLSELKMRSQAGATVMAVERKGAGIQVRGHLKLEAGDLIAVAGSTQALDSAAQILMDGEQGPS